MTNPRCYDLLLFGGARDPNILRLQQVSSEMGLDVLGIFHDQHSEPSFAWDLDLESFVLNGETVTAKSAFLRYDVFSSSTPNVGQLDRAYGWFTTVMGAACALRMHVPNSRLHAQATHKPFMLAAAKVAGLPVPRTQITNAQVILKDHLSKGEGIAKPVGGGAYTLPASEAIEMSDWTGGKTAMPAIVQAKLSYPEFRVFRIGDTYMTFRMVSEHLDYREHNDVQITEVDNSELGDGAVEKLAAMSDALGIDFFACDFKSEPETGVPVFLELNSGPMFAAFDTVADNRLSRTLITWLSAQKESEK